MNINKVNSSSYLNYQTSNRVNDKTTQSAQQPTIAKDQLEISDKAKVMSEKVNSENKINEIKEKVNSKFYFSDEVTNYVANALMKDVKS